MPLVACDIAAELRLPPLTTVRRRRAVLTTLVPMPEASVDKDDRFVFAQHYVGLAGKFPSVNTETKTKAMQQRADAHLGIRIFSANATHIPRAAFFCNPIFVHAFRAHGGESSIRVALESPLRTDECAKIADAHAESRYVRVITPSCAPPDPYPDCKQGHTANIFQK